MFYWCLTCLLPQPKKTRITKITSKNVLNWRARKIFRQSQIFVIRPSWSLALIRKKFSKLSSFTLVGKTFFGSYWKNDFNSYSLLNIYFHGATIVHPSIPDLNFSFYMMLPVHYISFELYCSVCKTITSWSTFSSCSLLQMHQSQYCQVVHHSTRQGH